MSKKNDNYWERRKAELIYRQMDKAEAQAKELDRIYNEAQHYLSRQADKIFDKFRRDYGLSETDARAILKNMKGKKTLSEMRKVLEARPEDPNISQLLSDMDSAAYSFRIKRFENLNNQVEHLREAMYQAEKKKSDKFYVDLMRDSYYRATFDIQQQTGFGYSFSTLPEAEIERLRRLKWSGDNYSKRIWNNTGELASRLKDEFLISFMTGRSSQEVVRAIADRFDVSKNESRRLIRTESAFFHNEMEALSYEEADVEYYRFISVLDLRTSAICREHDNKIYKVSERVHGRNYPPLHPWCRSTTVAHFDDEVLEGLKRRARDPATGKALIIPANMEYDDWYDKYVKPLYKVDGLNQWDINRTEEQYKRYQHILKGENIPKTLADFVNLKYNDKEGYTQLKDRVRWAQSSFPSEKSFNGHFRKHSSEFGDISQKQYLNLGQKLLAEPLSDDILGYDTEYRRVRYDLKHNIFALGDNKRGRLTTVLKPEKGVEYFEQDRQREFSDD